MIRYRPWWRSTDSRLSTSWWKEATEQTKLLLGQTVALKTVFLSFAVVQQRGAGAATRWTAAALWSGAWRGVVRRSWQLGLAEMAEQMLRMGRAGARVDLCGTQNLIWTNCSGSKLQKNRSSRFVWACFLVWSAVGYLVRLSLFSFHSNASACTNFS